MKHLFDAAKTAAALLAIVGGGYCIFIAFEHFNRAVALPMVDDQGKPALLIKGGDDADKVEVIARECRRGWVTVSQYPYPLVVRCR